MNSGRLKGVSLYIPFHKPYITEEEICGVVDSLRSGWLTMGPKTLRFEEAFARYTGAAHAVSVNSCTAALHMALKAIGLAEGDEAIVPAVTFTATAEVLSYFKAVPVFAEVEARTHNMNALNLERHITPRTRAILPVHFAGQPCDMDEIRELARRYRLFVIEDAAHSLPAVYRENRIGGTGDMTCFSFYATKTLAAGEGGMVTTGNPEWAGRMRTLRLHGISNDAWKRYSRGGSWYYEVMEPGWKYNMTDIQAALGLAQLGKVDWMRDMRAEIAGRYTDAFRHDEELIVPYVKPDRESAWHLYVLKLNLDMLRIGRDRFISEMEERGVGASVHFIPLYRQPYYRDAYGCQAKDYPVSEWIYERVLSLPIYPGMMREDVDAVIEVIKYLIKKFRR